MYRFSVLQFNELLFELGAPVSLIPHMVNVDGRVINFCPRLFRLPHCYI